MKNLENYGVVSLDAKEMKETDGGMFLHWGWYAGAFGLGLGTAAVIVYA